MLRVTALLALFFALGNAFMVAPTPRLTSPLFIMDPAANAEIMDKASSCAEGECSLDEVDDLIQVLKAEQRNLYENVERLKVTIQNLEQVNDKSGRTTDEVRETIRALYRVFQLGDKASGNDYPSLSKPTGWTGEVGDGPKTAYDSLPPKKWKP